MGFQQTTWTSIAGQSVSKLIWLYSIYMVKRVPFSETLELCVLPLLSCLTLIAEDTNMLDYLYTRNLQLQYQMGRIEILALLLCQIYVCLEGELLFTCRMYVEQSISSTRM